MSELRSKCFGCGHPKHHGYECAESGCDHRDPIRCWWCGRLCTAGEMYTNGTCCAPVYETPAEVDHA